MSRRWTDEQQLAIDARGCGLLVAAAAGSGKTSVLVERLLRILCDNRDVPAERLLVVTFTNDAANQMKQRLSEHMQALLEKKPDDEWIVRQYSMLPAAAISTIDSFCFNLIRQNIQLLDIAPNFSVIEPNDELLITERAYDDVLEALLRSENEDVSFLLDNACGGNVSKLREMVMKLENFMQGLPFPEEWAKNALDAFDMPQERLIAVTEEARRRLLRSAKAIRASHEEMLAELENVSFTGYIRTFSSDIERLDAVLDALEREGLSAGAHLLGRMQFDSLGTKDSKNVPDELRSRAKTLREAYINKIKELAGSLPDSPSVLEGDCEVQKRLLTALIDFVFRLRAEINAVKRDRGVLGFSDASRLTAQLLAVSDENGLPVPTALALELRELYLHVAIDEYQDVNDIQNLIFSMISRNESNIFAVGDIKQSIYRFRLANPDIFSSAMKKAKPYEDDARCYSVIRLRKNFRSSSQVVGLVNFVFFQLMSEDCGETDYSDGEELVCGAEYPQGDRVSELLLYSAAELPEANAVAARIKQMLASGTEVYDKGVLRPCTPRDFCILLRTHTHEQEFADALEAAGIKASSEQSKSFLSSYEIAALLDFLKVINNPALDVPLAGAAMSPVFMVSPSEMAFLRTLAGKASLFSAMEQHYDELSPGLRRLYDTICSLRVAAAGCDVEELIHRIYNMTDFLSMMQIHKDGVRRAANLRLLMKYVRSYGESFGGGLSGFLGYISRISDAGKDFETAPTVSGSDDAVCIKTIHKSKGLEFPFVFLCCLDTKIKTDDISEDVLFDKELGAGFTLYNMPVFEKYEAFAHNRIAEKKRREIWSEELRMLYVSMTRARERLFISLCADKLDERLSEAAALVTKQCGILPENVLSAKSHADMLILALSDCAGAEELFAHLEIKLPARYIFPCEAQLRLHTPSASAVCDTADIEALPPDDETVKHLLEMFDYSYNSRLSTLATKFSVTDIAKDEHPEGRLPKPKFDGGSKPLQGAEKGTAMHTYMQYCDFTAAALDPSAECDRLAENGYLTEQQRISIDTEHIAAFFRSPLYARIEKADKVMREQKFRIRMDELELEKISSELYERYGAAASILQGIADLVFEENGALVLVDYKTDYVTSAGQLVSAYSNQLRLYAAALEKIFAMPVREQIIYSFRLDEQIPL